MPSPNTLSALARELAPIADKYNNAHYREIDEKELCVIKQFLELHFIDVANISAERVFIHYSGKALIDPLEIFIKVIDEIGDRHEAAERYLLHLLRLNSGISRLKKFFGLLVPTTEAIMFERILLLKKCGALDCPKVLQLDTMGNQLVIAAWDDDQCFDGTHRYCGGHIARHRITKTLDALVCEKCNLHITIPMRIHLHGELNT